MKLCVVRARKGSEWELQGVDSIVLQTSPTSSIQVAGQFNSWVWGVRGGAGRSLRAVKALTRTSVSTIHAVPEARHFWVESRSIGKKLILSESRGGRAEIKMTMTGMREIKTISKILTRENQAATTCGSSETRFSCLQRTNTMEKGRRNYMVCRSHGVEWNKLIITFRDNKCRLQGVFTPSVMGS